MRQPMVVGNWKMNGSRELVQQLLTDIKTSLGPQPCEVVVAPPYVYLEQTAQLLADSPILWGAQNVSSESQGALTGEVSADMLADFKCRYVIVGHSERRTLFDEDDGIIAQKFGQAQKSGLIPILCVGETLQEREKHQTEAVIVRQLSPIFKAGYDLKKAVIAYEPVWAIGTGLAATPLQAQEVHALIREECRRSDQEAAESLRILYGGSVKASNAKSLFEMSDIDGGLIGGASLNAQEFVNICKAVK